jgi:hypothetical protein
MSEKILVKKVRNKENSREKILVREVRNKENSLRSKVTFDMGSRTK